MQLIQAPGGQLGDGSSWGMAAFLGGVGWRTWGNETQLPSRAHIDPSTSDPVTADSVFLSPLLLVAEPPPSMNFPSSVNPVPEKGKNGVYHTDQT